MRVFIDTNVLIDYFGAREQYFKDAVKLKAAAFLGDLDIWAASNSFTDVFYILNKEHKSHVIQDMFLSSKEFLHVCSVTPDDIYDAAEEKWSDFEDCLIHRAALKVKAQYLITRDKQGFTHAHMPCLSPAEFFERFEEETGISFDSISLQYEQ
jgi:predicted nucleic acid-binding protein